MKHVRQMMNVQIQQVAVVLDIVKTHGCVMVTKLMEILVRQTLNAFQVTVILSETFVKSIGSIKHHSSHLNLCWNCF